MTEGNDKLRFEASAYLQTLIGRELFRSEELAIVELVKNAYDSGAQRVVIAVRPQSLKEPGEIEIRDDGEGMALARFQRVFMFAGYSDRLRQVEDAARIPTGEKGIGRFAADRLGRRLIVLTKVKGASTGLRVEIDWSLFKSRQKKFSDVTVPYVQEALPTFGRADSGTILRITQLREQWDREQLVSLRRALAQLLDPYQRPTDFEIDLQVAGSPALSGPIRQAPLSGSDIEVGFAVTEDGKLRRWRRGRIYEADSGREEILAVDASPLAGLEGRFFYFLKRPTKEQSRGLLAGVRVYRDGFRIEPLGSQRTDWLGISEKRAKRHGHAHIVPSRLFGFVSISRRQHPDLKDTTSREALIDTAAARSLVSVLQKQLTFLENSILTDVDQPRWTQSRARKAVELERARFQSLSVMSFGLAHELRQPLQSIRFEAENITTRLGQLGVADPDIDEAQRNIDADIERIEKNIQLIASISSGSLETSDELDLASVVRDQCSFFATRCATQGIDFQVDVPPALQATVNGTLVGMVLINLIKNAIDELIALQDGRRRRICVVLRGEGPKCRLEVSDNGAGIPEEIRPKIFRKFATKKTGGMGVGLYNCKLLVRSHAGEIFFETQTGEGTTFVVELPKIG